MSQQQQQLSAIQYPEKFHLAEKFVDEEFGDLEKNSANLSNDSRLILYALRQQANKGPCKDAAPYFWNVTERYKHSAWTGLQEMPKPEAMVHYTRHLDQLKPKWLEVIAAKHPPPEAVAAAAQRASTADDDAPRSASTASALGGDSVEIPASPAPISLTATRNSSAASSSSSSNQSFEVATDIAHMSDSQLTALLTTPDGKIPSSVARGLVNEVLRLRRQLVVTSVSGVGSSSSVRRTPQRVEHRYYSSSTSTTNNNDSADATSGDAAAAASESEHKDPASAPQQESTGGGGGGGGGGWFSWFGGGGGRDDRTLQV